ncbi:MAG TPA: alpha/beta hydrolase [Candidatus Limnocylindrales bacterium]|nr:alpha/beta hydrolase [Candidatus Limnocylindrales bacterium]
MTDPWAHHESAFHSRDGLALYYQRWVPLGVPARAVIVLLHGAFAHSGWYVNLPRHEVPRGIAVYAYDQRGWGRSDGQRGHLERWTDCLDDLGAFLEVVRAAEPDRPIVLMGHTGSAAIVLDYALRHPATIRGVFCVSPALDLATIPAVLRFVAYLLSRIRPRLTIDARRRVEAGLASVSHDPAFVRFALDDPLRNTILTMRSIAELDAAVRRVHAQAGALNVPILILCGGADHVVPPASMRAYFERVGSADKTFHEYPGAYTNLLSDTVHDAVLADIDVWLDRVTQRSDSRRAHR